MRKLIKKILLLSCCMTCFFLLYDIKVDAKEIVVVLDPGHGGENEGGKYEEKGYIEKEITIRVAQAMKEELEKYEGIKVYTTRTTDKDLSLKQRVDFAKEVNADFIFCLHFNMSENHTLYGSECWVSAFGECYTKGYDFASIEMEELLKFGTYDRGIKTRIGKKGDDYYGIIRMATAAGIPSVIIEHCHMDHEKDWPALDLSTDPEKYGVADATAVAKYYGLKSDILGVDYSSYEYTSVGLPSGVVKPDSTPPVECVVNSIEIDETTGLVHANISSYDEESRMLYYTYSFDGGKTFEQYKEWPRGENSVDITLQLPYDKACELVFCTHNLFDLDTCSEVITTPVVRDPEVVAEEIRLQEYKEQEALKEKAEYEKSKGAFTKIVKTIEEDKISSILILGGVFLLGIGLTLLLIGALKRK